MLLELNFTLVLFAASFLVFIYLLNLTLFKPVGKVIEKRRNLVESEHSKAKESLENVTSLIESYKQKIKSARIESQSLLQEAVNEGKKKRDEKVSVLMAELNKEKETSLKKINEEKETAMKKMEGEIKQLTDLITNKVIGSEGKTLVRSL